ncbi:hypothetical protein [Deinococcus aquaedulcis]|uniref:hypothetical protein n=1 Tax=Deinococcus aquaedulcis TaxID=2840455 RepID=UPI001C82B771|nr:hypothetical protein [Deinococcus aquaedulcis]
MIKTGSKAGVWQQVLGLLGMNTKAQREAQEHQRAWRAGLWQYRDTVDEQLTFLNRCLGSTWVDQDEAFKREIRRTLKGLLTLAHTPLALQAGEECLLPDVRAAFDELLGAAPEAFSDPVEAAGRLISGRITGLMHLLFMPENWTVEEVEALREDTRAWVWGQLRDGHPLKPGEEVLACA